MLETRSLDLHVLFVCTGNICRSPTAERLAATYATQARIPEFTASSAGTRAVISHPMHHEASLVLEKLGGDATDFAARQLTPKIAAGADLVITMTKAHRDNVLEIAPRLLRRTFTLTEAAWLASVHQPETLLDLTALRPELSGADLPDILDPIGQAAEVFKTVGEQIADLLQPVMALCQHSTAPKRD